MARAKTQYVCSECGGASPKWQGQCPHCNAWNTLAEARVEAAVEHRYAPLGTAMRVANAAAGVVVGKLGTATVTPDELR